MRHRALCRFRIGFSICFCFCFWIYLGVWISSSSSRSWFLKLLQRKRFEECRRLEEIEKMEIEEEWKRRSWKEMRWRWKEWRKIEWMSASRMSRVYRCCLLTVYWFLQCRRWIELWIWHLWVWMESKSKWQPWPARCKAIEMIKTSATSWDWLQEDHWLVRLLVEMRWNESRRWSSTSSSLSSLYLSTSNHLLIF